MHLLISGDSCRKLLRKTAHPTYSFALERGRILKSVAKAQRLNQGEDSVVYMIGYPKARELTQGTIFTCATSEDYTEVSPLGIVITARCDIAHGKAPVISYVPLISFREWLFRDGLRLLASRVLSASKGAMRSALRDLDLAESMLETLSQETLHAHMSELTGKTERNAVKRYLDAEAQQEAAKAALNAPTGQKAAADFLDSRQKDYQKLMQELLSNAIADYHFIDRSEPDEKSHGYVALLREIRYLPATLAMELKDGIDYQRFAEICREQPGHADKLTIVRDDQYAMPVGLVQSPFIELFMQRFTSLYARIGVTDFSPDLLASLCEIVPLNIRDPS